MMIEYTVRVAMTKIVSYTAKTSLEVRHIHMKAHNRSAVLAHLSPWCMRSKAVLMAALEMNSSTFTWPVRYLSTNTNTNTLSRHFHPKHGEGRSTTLSITLYRPVLWQLQPVVINYK